MAWILTTWLVFVAALTTHQETPFVLDSVHYHNVHGIISPSFLDLSAVMEDDPKKADALFGDPVTHPELFKDPKNGILVPVGKKFKLQCQCNRNVRVPLNRKLPMQYPRGSCGGGDVKIKRLMTGVGMTADDIRDFIGPPIFLDFAYVKEHHFSTIEGRTDVPILATPGGDIAEFINAMDVFEEFIHTPLNDGHCVWFLRSYLHYTGKRSFYMATDTTATKMMGIDSKSKGIDLREAPPEAERQKIFDELTMPEHVGCAHLRAMMSKPHEYNIRPGLPVCIIKAFFRLLWDLNQPIGRKLRLVELEGVNNEQAVIKIRSSSACHKNGLSPLLKPRGAKGSLIVIHSQASTIMREELANYFARFNRWIDVKRFLKRMNENAMKYEELAIFRMARMGTAKPVYEVTIE